MTKLSSNSNPICSDTNAIFNALSDQTRRSIYQQLSLTGEQTVRALTDGAGVSQPAVSKHLGILKLAGLVTGRHVGRETYYSAQPDRLRPLMDWMGLYGAFWNDRLDKLEDLLKAMDQ